MNEQINKQLEGHTDQAVEDTLSDLMTKYDALAEENVALRKLLETILDHQIANRGKPSSFFRCFTYGTGEFPGWVIECEQALSTPSPQVAKIEAVLEAAEKYASCLELSAEGRPLDDYDRDCAALSVARAVRNLRGDK